MKIDMMFNNNANIKFKWETSMFIIEMVVFRAVLASYLEYLWSTLTTLPISSN